MRAIVAAMTVLAATAVAAPSSAQSTVGPVAELPAVEVALRGAQPIHSSEYRASFAADIELQIDRLWPPGWTADPLDDSVLRNDDRWRPVGDPTPLNREGAQGDRYRFRRSVLELDPFEVPALVLRVTPPDGATANGPRVAFSDAIQVTVQSTLAADDDAKAEPGFGWRSVQDGSVTWWLVIPSIALGLASWLAVRRRARTPDRSPDHVAALQALLATPGPLDADRVAHLVRAELRAADVIDGGHAVGDPARVDAPGFSRTRANAGLEAIRLSDRQRFSPTDVGVDLRAAVQRFLDS